MPFHLHQARTHRINGQREQASIDGDTSINLWRELISINALSEDRHQPSLRFFQ